MDTMKYVIAVFFSFLALVGIKSFVEAETTNNVSVNSSGGETQVNVSNNMNTSSTTTQSVKSTTNVRIETNGEVKEFKTTGDEAVNWTSNDGKSSVKINNNTVTKNQTQNEAQSTSQSATPSHKNEDKKENASQSSNTTKESREKEATSFIEQIFSWITSLFS